MSFAGSLGVVGGGTISFNTGVMPDINGGSFSGTGWFSYVVPNDGSGHASNVTGQATTTYSGRGTTRTYHMTLAFSGVDDSGRPYTATSTQLITIKITTKGITATITAADNGGTTTIEHY